VQPCSAVVSLQPLRAPGRTLADGDLDVPLTVPESGVTEILVHGVGGATPQSMLDETSVTQVTGDRISGMWRGPDRLVDGTPRWHREAYSWGGLTSRAFTGALWLLLAPLAVMNLAGWMAVGRRFAGTGRPDSRIVVQQALVRVIALAATWTYVLFVAQITMDLGAWQCTQISRCRIGDWPSVVPLPLAGFPARTVALAAAVPVLFVLGLYLLTRVSVRRYEGFPVAAKPAGTVDPARVRLTDPQFWSGAAYANASRWLHLISSTTVVAWLLTAVARRGGRWPRATDLLGDALLAVLGSALVCAGWQRANALLLNGFRRVCTATVGALGLLGAAAVLAWAQPRGPLPGAPAGDPGIMPGVLEGFNALVLLVYALGLLHGVVAAAGRYALGRDPVRPPRMPAPFMALAVGAWLLFAVWAGTTTWVASWLSPSARPADQPTAGRLVYSTAYPALAQLSLLGLGVVLLIVLGFAGWCWFARRPTMDAESAYWNGFTLPGDYERASRPPPDRETGGPEAPAGVAAQAPSRWLMGVRRTKWWTANAVCWIETGIAWAAGLIALGVVAGRPPARYLNGWWVPREAFASTVLSLIPVASVLLVRQAIRSPGTRRLVGVAWDIATFWPRAFHPLAPPSYAERAIPELELRVRHLLSHKQSVLLLGHSQGAALVTATVARLHDLPGDARARLAAVTYGNPVRRLYMRWFPSYVHPQLMSGLLDDKQPGTRLVNFFRHTDPIGGRVYAGADEVEVPAWNGDCWLPDPPTDLHRPGDGTPRVRGHAQEGYVRQSLFAGHVAAEVRRLDGYAEPP
jgi:hypothetical protein